MQEEVLKKHLNGDLRKYKSEERIKLNERYDSKERNLLQKFNDNLKLEPEPLGISGAL